MHFTAVSYSCGQHFETKQKKKKTCNTNGGCNAFFSSFSPTSLRDDPIESVSFGLPSAGLRLQFFPVVLVRPAVERLGAA